MAHTPGLWYAAARQGDDFKSVVAVNRTDEICQCFHPDLTLRGKEQCEANACLIAAAPEMLEALKTLHDAASLSAIPFPMVLAKAAAAIAKAEGREG